MRPVVPGSEVVRIWNEIMVPLGYPEAEPGWSLERLVDMVTRRDVYRTLHWWEHTVFPAVHVSWLGVERARDPASLYQLVLKGDAKIVDLIARAKAMRPAEPKPGSASWLAQLAMRTEEE